MVMIYHERKDADKPDRTLFEVPRDDKSIADRVQEKFGKGSTIYTDEFRAYSQLEERGFDCHTVNHSKGDYAHGDGNYIHTNNAECRVGLLKFWLKKHRGVNKWHLELYVKTFQFIHNHRHYDMGEKYIITLVAILGQYEGRQANRKEPTIL